MKLPNNSIGISDILAWRDCPRRMSYSMRRHEGEGQQTNSRTPEAQSAAAAYGSCIHDAIYLSEDGYTDEDAIQGAWSNWGRWLEPGDLTLLREDMVKYHDRDFPNTRTVMSEDEVKVPLFEHEGEMIFFRGKIDRLLERIDAPGVFIHIDYKSSRHAKSEKEVHQDLQMWAYNWAIYETYPEIETLVQTYDQLRYGQIPTRKSDEQRREIRDWLIVNVKALLLDEEYGPDGLLQPTYNQWCPWCGIMESCPVVAELSEFALTRIAELAPVTPKLKKNGEPSKVMQRVPLDPERIDEYVAEMEKATLARKVLDRYEDSVKSLLKEMPTDSLRTLGYAVRERSNTVFTTAAMAALHETLGDRFYEVAKVTKTGLENALVEDADLLSWALGLADVSVDSTQTLVPLSK